MPTSGLPITDLGPQLASLLLRSAGWLTLAAVIVGAVTWAVSRRDTSTVRRVTDRLFGPSEQAAPEPSARRYLRFCFGGLWIVDGLLQAQPDMPGGFVSRVIAAPLGASPSWLANLVQPLVRTWTRHPVAADAVTVWIQVGLGVLILIGGRGLLSRGVLWLSVLWSLGVWIAGEFLGGLLTPGASWLTGAPGAVLVYALAGVLLLLPLGWWESGRCARLARRAVGAWLLVGALLQALPWEQFWSGAGLSTMFANGAQNSQYSIVRHPITLLASWTLSHPALLNGVLVAALVVIGLGLLTTDRTSYLVAGLVLCLATWWLAQDFGVLGGTGTDPNTGLPLALLLGCAAPRWSSVERARPRARWVNHRLTVPTRAGLAAAGLGAVIAAPLLITGQLAGPPDAAAVAADSGGGVVTLASRPAPDFLLSDQKGRPVSLAKLRGKVTVLTFLDPVCSDECPVIANQLALADAQLGALAKQVEFVAIDSNPVFHAVSDVAAFTTSHGLAGLPNWHFLAGDPTALRAALSSYGIAVAVPAVGMIEHSEGIYFISADGGQVAYLGDAANSDLTTGYGDQVRLEIEKLLR